MLIGTPCVAEVIDGPLTALELCPEGYQLKADWDFEVDALKYEMEAGGGLRPTSRRRSTAAKAAEKYFLHKNRCEGCRHLEPLK